MFLEGKKQNEILIYLNNHGDLKLLRDVAFKHAQQIKTILTSESIYR